MSDRQFERAVSDWLEDGSDRTPRRAIDGVLLAVKTTPQERDLRIPWRFKSMPALSRATGIAAVALVAVVGAGALLYLNSSSPSGPGGPTTPAATQAPTTAPTAAPTATPPAIPGWTTYDSAVYGFTMAYPSDWKVEAPAEHKWQTDEPAVVDGWPWADAFASPDGEIGMWVFQVPAPAGSDLDTWHGLTAAFGDVCEVPSFGPCNFQRVDDRDPTTLFDMCLGQQECKPALLVLKGDDGLSPSGDPWGVLSDPDTNTITFFQMGRPDDFPQAAKYGGTVALLKAILAQVDVREPEPGETPR